MKVFKVLKLYFSNLLDWAECRKAFSYTDIILDFVLYVVIVLLLVWFFVLQYAV